MSKTNCSVHEICMWELALEGAKRNAETAIHRMEKAESELTKLRKRVEVLSEALKFYARQNHFSYDGDDEYEPENPSGEHMAIKCGGADGSEFTYEDGFTAREALAESAKIAGEK